MPLDHCVALGRSELRVSPFALGALQVECPAPMRGAQRGIRGAQRGISVRRTTVDGEPSIVYPPLLESTVRY